MFPTYRNDNYKVTQSTSIRSISVFSGIRKMNYFAIVLGCAVPEGNTFNNISIRMRAYGLCAIFCTFLKIGFPEKYTPLRSHCVRVIDFFLTRSQSNNYRAIRHYRNQRYYFSPITHLADCYFTFGVFLKLL